jgi:tetratricopeptide (TPR) repeat protein
MAHESELNLDDLPRLEFSAPRNLGRDTTTLNAELTRRFVVPPVVEGADPEHDPTGALALSLAYGYRATQERAQALTWVERALRDFPGNPEARLLHARLLAEEERPIAAAEELRKVVEGPPAYAAAAVEVASNLEAADAIAILRRIQERNPRLTEPRVALAEALYKGGHYRQAESEYREIQRDRPTDRRVLYGLGRALLAQGVYDRALAALDEAGKSGEGSGEFQADRGEVLMWLGRYGEAVTAYRLALRSNVEQVTWRLNLGIALAQLGPSMAQEAEQRFREVLAMDSANTRAWEELHKLGKRL